MDYEERVGMDSRCNVKGCDEQSTLLMPSVELPRQLCSMHVRGYVKKEYPEEYKKVKRMLLGDQ